MVAKWYLSIPAALGPLLSLLSYGQPFKLPMPLRYAAEVIEFDEYEEEEEDYERLPCSGQYVVVCLWLPLLNGCIHGFTGWGKRLAAF